MAQTPTNTAGTYSLRDTDDVPTQKSTPPRQRFGEVVGFTVVRPPPPIELHVRTQAAPTTRAVSPGTLVGGYEVLEEVARGGMGVVCRARQRGSGRIVALKLLIASSLAKDDVRRFLLEAHMVSRMRHRAICRVYDVGHANGYHYQALEFVHGQSLHRWVRSERPSLREILRVAGEICEGVHCAHVRGVVHRDIKPANIMVDREGNPRILDFGIAKAAASEAVDDASTVDQGDSIIGTPYYMPPEQAAGNTGEIDLRSDVYAVGAVLYECLTGEPPFADLTPQEFLVRVMVGHPDPVRDLAPKTPVDLVAVVEKCLHKEKASRYQSALELKRDLDRVARGLPVSARPASRTRRAHLWARRHPVAASLAVVATALAVGALADRALRHAAAAEHTNRLLAGIDAQRLASEEDLTSASATLDAAERAIAAALADAYPDRALDEALFTLGEKRRHIERRLAALEPRSSNPQQVGRAPSR
jgi:predicted Ser/Thr protein kinase